MSIVETFPKNLRLCFFFKICRFSDKLFLLLCITTSICVTCFLWSWWKRLTILNSIERHPKKTIIEIIYEILWTWQNDTLTFVAFVKRLLICISMDFSQIVFYLWTLHLWICCLWTFHLCTFHLWTFHWFIFHLCTLFCFVD